MGVIVAPLSSRLLLNRVVPRGRRMKRRFFYLFLFFFSWLLGTYVSWHAIVSWKLVSKDFMDIALFRIENYRRGKII